MRSSRIEKPMRALTRGCLHLRSGLGGTVIQIAASIAVIAVAPLESTAAQAEEGPSSGSGPVVLWHQAKRGDFVALDSAKALPRASPCLVAAELAASHLDRDAAARNMKCFKASIAEDPAAREVALEVEAGVAFAFGDYKTAAIAAETGSSLATDLKQPQDAAELAQTSAVAALLSRQPRQRLVSGTARAVAATRDAVGLMRVPAAVNGGSIDMIVDTGANISVLSTSAAKRLGLRMNDGDASVGSSTRAAVGVRIGVADRMEVGGLIFENVAFLVLEDRDLSPSTAIAYKIDGILGFPVFMATSGFTFGRDGTFTPAPPAMPGVHANLRAIGSDLFVEAWSGGRYSALHLDTGAAATGLSWLFAERNPDMIAAASHRAIGAAGAGGETRNEVAELPALDLHLGSETFNLANVNVQLNRDASPGAFGVLGQDVLRRVSWYGIDLRSMSLVLGPMSAPRP